MIKKENNIDVFAKIWECKFKQHGAAVKILLLLNSIKCSDNQENNGVVIWKFQYLYAILYKY